jgi:signal transduction histidine kinase
MRGDNAEEFFRRGERGIELRTVATFAAALRQLSEGQHDAVVMQRLKALRLMRELGLRNLQVVGAPIAEFRQELAFAVREGDKDTLALLNEGLALAMADGTFRRLHAKWFAALETPSRRRLVIGGDLIGGLLRLSRLTRTELRPEPLDMDRLVQAVAAAMEHQIGEAGAEFRREPLPACRGEAGQIGQVVSNLLDNALKYRDPSRPPRIRVSGTAQGAEAVYCVEDNGIGIKPEFLDKIWSVFVRLDPRGSLPGEGLGLTVVRRIIQRHGGRTWVDSTPGQGSRFYFALPNGDAPTETGRGTEWPTLNQEHAMDSTQGLDGVCHSGGTGTAGKGTVILVAEDDDGHAELVEGNLREAGLTNEIRRFRDGEETLDFFLGRGSRRPEYRVGQAYVLLLDIRMPKVDGVLVLERLKSTPHLRDMPVIMLTTADDPREVQRCYDLGCNCYIAKPVAYSAFSAVLHHLGRFIATIEVPRLEC